MQEGDADAIGAIADPATNGVFASSGPGDTELQKSAAGVLLSKFCKTKAHAASLYFLLCHGIPA